MSTTQDQITETIMQCGKLMKQHMTPHKNLGSLTIAQIQTLIFLKHTSPATMSDIAKFFSIELPSATSLINKLVKQEYVKRLSNPTDRRIVNIILTEKGEVLLSEVMRERSKKMKLLVSVLTEEEQVQLLSILKKFTIKLEEKDER